MKISIILCTLNRASVIITALNSVAKAIENAAPAEAEIVIVDNGSTDNTPALIADWAQNSSLNVNIVNETRKGLSRARNTGMKAAKGDLFIFTDDDCVLDPDYIRIALRYAANDAMPVLRGGRVELGDETDLPLTIKTEMQVTRRDINNEPASVKYYSMGNLILGCNMVMPRPVFEKIGNFDERLGAGTTLPGGEETDYICRAYLAGVPIEYIPDLVVEHFHGRKKKADGHKLFGNYFIGNGALYMKYIFVYPIFCRQFYWDLKKAVKEIKHKRNDFMPVIDFSYGDMIVFNIKGALIFLKTLLQGKRPYPN